MSVKKASPEEEKDCLEFMRSKLKEDDDLAKVSLLLPDRVLLHFIRGRKYKRDVAYKTLEQYIHNRRHKYRELYIELIPSKIKLRDFIGIVPLKALGPKGEFILVSRVHWFPFNNLKLLTFNELLMKVLCALHEICKNEAAEFSGISILLDFTDFSFQHSRMLGTYNNIMMLFNIFYKAIPLRYRSLHYINVPLPMKFIHNFAKQFLPSKIIEKVHLHNNYKTLHDHISPATLPTIFGGELTEEEAFDFDINNRILKNDNDYRELAEKL